MSLAEPRQDPRLRDVLLLALGAAGTALCITLMYQGMRAVMDIGGACADGGPFVPVQPCPDGVAISIVFSSFGLFLFGGIATWYGVKVGGVWTAAPLLAWSGLFLALGWNFIDYGIVNPPNGEDVIWGWLIPGVLFIIMGVVPLVLGATVLGTVRASPGGRGRGSPPVILTYPIGPGPGSPPASSVATDVGHQPGTGFEEGTQALLDRLERLADLRDRGLLVEAEYETAKDTIMRELETRS
jgi:hypothetical protein